MRTIVDTCVIIDWATDPHALDDGIWDILDDPENRIFISAETVKELVVNFNNKEQDHRDPSDHIIISHALTNRMTLISSDTKFPFYRNQGLDLIEY